MFRYIFALLAIVFTMSMQAAPKYKVRAAWVTTVYRLDWPKTSNNSGRHPANNKQNW